MIPEKKCHWKDMKLPIHYNQMYMDEVKYFFNCVTSHKETFNSVQKSLYWCLNSHWQQTGLACHMCGKKLNEKSNRCYYSQNGSHRLPGKGFYKMMSGNLSLLIMWNV